jgi:putative tryptophan/tyrosine transport system substrate-binding protein
MKRRVFVLVLGSGMISARPVRPQQRAMPVVGLLGNGSPDTSPWIVDAIHKGLADTGYVEGRNVSTEYRWADGRYDRLPALAAELVDRQVDVIMASGPGIAAAKGATAAIPIVFFGGGDLVANGLIASLAHPGGNLTGVSIFDRELDPKRLQLLSELVSQTDLIALLVNPNFSNAQNVMRDVQEAARGMGRQLSILRASSEGEIDTAMATAVQLDIGGIVIASDPFFTYRAAQLVALAARHAVPVIYEWREIAEAGGLISYGPSRTGAMRQVGVYVGRVLAGAKPADLPIQQPTRFELVVNLKTAKALGLTIPQSILGRADEVIE